MNSSQIETFMKQSPLGVMIPLIAEIENKHYVVLALKETGGNIRLLPKKVKVYATVAPIPINNVIVVSIFVELPDWPGNRYECVYNFHANPKMLDIWINQEVQPVAFYTKEGRKRMIALDNDLIGGQLAGWQQTLVESSAWTTEDFDKAKAEYFQQWRVLSV